MQDLGQVRHAPRPRRVVGQTAHVGIVLVAVGHPLFDEGRGPRLIGQPFRQLRPEVEGQRRAADLAVAGDERRALVARIAQRDVPDAREIRFAVRQTRRRRAQIGSAVCPSGHALGWIVQPLTTTDRRDGDHGDEDTSKHACAHTSHPSRS